MENKNQKVWVIVSLSTLLFLTIIFIGMGYAFFTANNPEGSTAQIISKNGRMLITYNDGTDNIQPVTGMVPSNAIIVNKTFSLTGSNTTVGMSTGDGLSMPYKVGVQYTSGFSDGMLHYYIKEVDRPTDSKVTTNYVITPETGKTEDDYKNQTVPGNPTYTGYVHGTFKNGKKYTEMVTGEFPASLNDQTIRFNLIMQFPDNNENQDSEKGKTFNGKIVINQELSAVEKITELYNSKIADATNGVTEDGLKIDDTSDANIRYVGEDYVENSPKNFLYFNDEIWRIIGVFNNVITIDNDGTESKETLLKIVKTNKLGSYSWDSSSSDINDGMGINEWHQADLMYELNCDGSESSPYCRDDIKDGYLSNKTSGTAMWYSYSANQMKNYEYSNNIKYSSIDKIANVRWNLGGMYNATDALTSYNAERGTNFVSNPTDGIKRNATWDGKVALPYPSDYLYTVINKLGWLNPLSSWFSLSPGIGNESYILGMNGETKFKTYYAGTGLSVLPTIFLKSNVMIIDGTGTESDPFIIG